jgi:hypothetical protein
MVFPEFSASTEPKPRRAQEFVHPSCVRKIMGHGTSIKKLIECLLLPAALLLWLLLFLSPCLLQRIIPQIALEFAIGNSRRSSIKPF